VVAAPSGAGKSSLVKALMELDAGVQHSVSHTTRAPRGQEFHGREYFFIDDAQFDEMVATNAFLEWAYVHGNRYGTSSATIQERISQGTAPAAPPFKNAFHKAWMLSWRLTSKGLFKSNACLPTRY